MTEKIDLSTLPVFSYLKQGVYFVEKDWSDSSGVYSKFRHRPNKGHTTKEGYRQFNLLTPDNKRVTVSAASIISALQLHKNSEQKKKTEVSPYILEEQIMDCWSITNDLNSLRQYIKHSNPDTKTVQDLLESISTLYSLKFEMMFRAYEEYIWSCR